MGLGTVDSNNGLYLSIAGGFIWNRKADQSDPNYAVQAFVKADKTEGERAGARYADLDGMVVGVEFRTHDEYGQNLNMTFEANDQRYIISISTNNRYSQDAMKALLNADLTKPIYMKPYDFVGKDKRRAMGISFRQGGEKIDLRVDNVPTKEKEWFATAAKKDIRRFFEDLNDWFVAEVEEKVCPQFGALPPKAKPEAPTKKVAKEEKAAPKEEVAKATPLKMKQALKKYIEENYEGQTLPSLGKEELVTWYNLSVEMEDLPFEDEDDSDEVDSDDLDDQLSKLL
jgi:hypothetical protein